MSDGGKRPVTPAERKVVALLPVGMGLVSIGVVLTLLFDRDLVKAAGMVALGAGVVILLVMVLRLQRLKRESRS